MGPGGFRGAFFSPAFAAERGLSLPALSPFLISDGLSGKEVGLSSEGRFGNLVSIAFGTGLSATLGWLPVALALLSVSGIASFCWSVGGHSLVTFLAGGGGKGALSRIPAWLSGRGGLGGLNGLTGSVTAGGLEARFKEFFLSPLGGHSRFRSGAGGNFGGRSSLSTAGASGLAGFGGVGFKATWGCEAG